MRHSSLKKMFSLALVFIMFVILLPVTSLAVPSQGWYSSPGSADGSFAAPYIISSADDLAGLALLVNGGNSFEGKYIQIASASSIDMAAYSNWTPIGTLTKPFKGTLDGNGATLTNLTINDTQTFTAPQSIGLGLFGLIGPGGAVQDLTLSALNVQVNYSISPSMDVNSYIGGIAGMNEGTISNCAVSGIFDIDGVVVKVGGITGSNGSDSGSTGNTYGTIEDCTTDCDITANSSYQLMHGGGIAGSSTKATGIITGCSSQGVITASGTAASDGTYRCSPNVGGLIGYADNAIISDCTSDVDVAVTEFVRSSYVGGLIGFALNSIIDGSSSSGDVIAYGGDNPAYGDDVAAGGLVGRLSYASATTRIENCFSTGDAQATVKSVGKSGYALAGGLVGYVKYFGAIPSEIVSSYATGNANAVALDNGYAFAGGFAGFLWTASVDKCFGTGDAQGVAALNGYASAGGFAGYASSNGATTTAISNCYSIGNASADCVTKERAGGFVGAVSSTSTFTNCYSVGRPIINHSGANFAVGGFVGAAANTYTLTNVYYDSTVTPAIPGLGVGTGTVNALSTDSMVADDTLLTGMSGLQTGSAWDKRTNTLSERYYPELAVFMSAGGTTGAASRNSVTIPAATYTLTVVNGSGSGSCAAGQVVSIAANTPASGQQFSKWTTSGGGSFLSDTNAVTTFTMPHSAVTVTATYQAIPNSGPGSDDGGNTPGKTITVVEAPKGIENPRQITVTPVGDAFDRSIEVRLKDDPVAKAQIENALEQSPLQSDMEDALVYPLDISMYIKGTDTKVQPKEGTSVEITCPIPADLLAKRDKLVVVCLIDGKLTVLPTTVVAKGNTYYVQFTASHFSPYAFVVDENNKLFGLANVTPIDPVGIPKTGDAGFLYAGVVLLVGAVALLGVYSKKKV